MSVTDFSSLIQTMLVWFNSHETVLWALGAFSALTFVGSILWVPLLIIRLPENYFMGKERPLTDMKKRHPLEHFLLEGLKNILGFVLILCGIVMLVIPGQGLLTILLGIFLMNFPGKYHLEQTLVRQEKVLESLNWIRLRANKPTLKIQAKQER